MKGGGSTATCGEFVDGVARYFGKAGDRHIHTHAHDDDDDDDDDASRPQ
jgi:hypothetical protein